MNRSGITIMMALAAVLLVAFATSIDTALAKKPDYESIADKIVNHSLQVKPEETVIITGTPAEEELLKALVVATAEAGGQVTVEISYADANKKAMMAMPLEYLNMARTYPIMQMRAAGCFINLGSVQDPTLFSDVPEERFAAWRRGGADYQEMMNMFWKAVDIDYQALTGTASSAQAMLAPGSASGTVVVPHMEFRGMNVTNLRMTFSNGRMTGMTADEHGKALQEYFAQTDGDANVLSLLDVGLNPNCQPLQGSDYLSWEMSGVVTVGVGDNSWAGGSVIPDGGMYFHLANATMSVNGIELVASGNLKMDELTAK